MTTKFKLTLLALIFHFAIVQASDVAPNSPGLAGAAEPSGPPVSGTVLEVKDVDSFSYLRLRTGKSETWAAVTRSAFKVGDAVRLEQTLIVNNFESKSLKRTFPTLVFGKVAMAGAKPATAPVSPDAAPDQLPAGHPVPAAAAVVEELKVSKAVGTNARTVAEILSKASELKDKPVLVHARVVKFNGGILGRNWVHMRDGSGLAAQGTHDLVATTADVVKAGDIVTVHGLVHTDRDFGAGYAFRVILEEATLRH